MAETGAQVVLVDANLRSPGVGRYLALDNSHGLTDVLTGNASVPAGPAGLRWTAG